MWYNAMFYMEFSIFSQRIEVCNFNFSYTMQKKKKIQKITMYDF